MELVTIRDVAKQLSIGRTALWQLTKDDSFPKLVQVTKGRKAFIKSEIDNWIADRIAARDQVSA